MGDRNQSSSKKSSERAKDADSWRVHVDMGDSARLSQSTDAIMDNADRLQAELEHTKRAG
jgi:hypothetical protein